MIGILYESDEWSDHKLASELEALGNQVLLLDMETAADKDVLACDHLVNRVFASAGFREHTKSLQRMPALFERIGAAGIPLLNPAASHAFETSKALATETLARAGLPVPQVFATGRPCELLAEYGVMDSRDIPGDTLDTVPDRIPNPVPDSSQRASCFIRTRTISYPCVIKPDCGGRTTHTAIAYDADELVDFLVRAPDIVFVVEEYVKPTYGYLTRVEVIGDECVLIVKRSVASNGLSSYHVGSSYEHYADCPQIIRDVALSACRLLSVELGSLDIIESATAPTIASPSAATSYSTSPDRLAIIDVNAVSNVSEDNTAMFGFDLMAAYARYIDRRFKDRDATAR